jgi:hypothetical protein
MGVRRLVHQLLQTHEYRCGEAAHPPVISVTYNAVPGTPTAQAVAPCYFSCGAGARTSGLRPTLSAKLADGDAGQAVRAEFEVRNKATAATVATSGTLTGNPGWTNGSTATWQVNTDLTNGTSISGGSMPRTRTPTPRSAPSAAAPAPNLSARRVVVRCGFGRSPVGGRRLVRQARLSRVPASGRA